MKNLFSFEVKTGDMPFNKYIIKKTDGTVSEKEESAFNSAKAFEKKYSLPLYLQIIMYVCAGIAVIALGGVASAFTEGTSLSQAYKNAAWVFYIGGICLVVGVILGFISFYLRKKGGKDPELQVINRNLNSVVEEGYNDLGVPEGALEMSVVIFPFKAKKGKEKPASLFVRYFMVEVKVYADLENLYIADISSLTAIPFSDIQKIVENKKRVEFPEWTKDESFKSPKYKPYKVRAFQYGYTAKTYSVQIVKDGEELEVIVPNYEIETLKTFLSVPVIGLKQKKKKSKDC